VALAPVAAPAQQASAAASAAANASSGAGKISLQTLSAMAKPLPAPAPMPAPVQAATPVAAAPVVVAAVNPAPQSSRPPSAQVWNYVVSTLGGKDQAEQIRVLDTIDGWQRLSNGSEIHLDGRVRAVRFGSYIVKAVSDDSFLKLPAKAGQSGANTALVTDAQGRGVNARVIWRTEAAGDTVKLVASVDGVSFVLRYEAFFGADQLLPLRYESEMKNRLAAGPAQTMTARLQ
jgi:hypothetical protein